jgi:hypothetical protein
MVLSETEFNQHIVFLLLDINGLTICYWESRSKEGEKDEEERLEIHDVDIVNLVEKSEKVYTEM